MENWFQNKEEVKRRLINSIMEELEYLINNNDKTANYWIDDVHNVFAFVNDNGDDDRWIEIHFELHDYSGDIVGDLLVLNTQYVNKDDLLKEIKTIVDMYYED